MTPNFTSRPFSPDYAIPPGESLIELLDAKGLSQADLAERTGRPKKTINEIVKGKAAITPETAIQLERVLGIPASYWNSLEQLYRSAVARKEERERLHLFLPWLGQFPVSEMIKRKWIEPRADRVELLEQLLSFFGVASPNAWNEVWLNGKEAAAFRRQNPENPNTALVATWLQHGEIMGRKVRCEPFDASRFKQALSEIRECTSDPDINESCQTMIRLCAEAGVAVVLTQEFPKLGVFGATRWLSPDKALIQLSLHYKRADQFWFSFFHEAGHILLHGKKEIFVEESKAIRSRDEDEADKFAADFLIPQNLYSDFIRSANFSTSAIIDFANKLKISPSIIVGRLQHEKIIRFNEKSDLIVRLRWAESN